MIQYKNVLGWMKRIDIEQTNCFCNIIQALTLVFGLYLVMTNMEKTINNLKYKFEENIKDYDVLQRDYYNLVLQYNTLLERFENDNITPHEGEYNE